MSTTYYKLRDGYTVKVLRGVTIRYDDGAEPAAHAVINYEGVSVGAVLLDHARMLAGDDHAAVRSGGKTTVYATGLDSDYAVSEYGELVTLGQLRRNEQP